MNANSAQQSGADRVALIADVADSRRIDDFPRRRDRLLAELSEGHRARGWIQSDYAVTAWDEFQGLLDRPACLPEVAWSFWRTFRPWSLRLALGIGAVTRVPDAEPGAPLNRTVTGEAFYRAREALDELDTPRHGSSRVRVLVGPAADPRARAANAVLRLADALVQDITDRQWQVIAGYERHGKQSAVAAELSVSESTISRGLASARYWEIRASLGELADLLDDGLRHTGDSAARGSD